MAESDGKGKNSVIPPATTKVNYGSVHPKGWRGRSESPLLASAEAKPLLQTKSNTIGNNPSSREDSPPAVTALLHRRRFHMHNHLRGDVLVQAHLNLHIADGADVLALDVALVHRNAVLRLQLLGNFRARN